MSLVAALVGRSGERLEDVDQLFELDVGQGGKHLRRLATGGLVEPFDERSSHRADREADDAAIGRIALALDEALQELEQLEPRQAMLVESRFFGGLDVLETAELLEVSEATVHREWRAAKAWLKHRLRQ